MKKFLFLMALPLLMTGCATQTENPFVNPYDEAAVTAKMESGVDDLTGIYGYVGPTYLLSPESAHFKNAASLRAFSKGGKTIYEALVFVHSNMGMFDGMYSKAILDNKKQIMTARKESKAACFQRAYKNYCARRNIIVIPLALEDLQDHINTGLTIRLQGYNIEDYQMITVPSPYIKGFFNVTPQLRSTNSISEADEKDLRDMAGLQSIIVVGSADLDTSFLDQMIKGKTTIEEAKEHFGKPYRVDTDAKGRSLYQWISNKISGNNSEYKHIAVVFDAKGKFEYIKVRKD